jgi:hypothetical protein
MTHCQAEPRDRRWSGRRSGSGSSGETSASGPLGTGSHPRRQAKVPAPGCCLRMLWMYQALPPKARTVGAAVLAYSMYLPSACRQPRCLSRMSTYYLQTESFKEMLVVEMEMQMSPSSTNACGNAKARAVHS